MALKPPIAAAREFKPINDRTDTAKAVPKERFDKEEYCRVARDFVKELPANEPIGPVEFFESSGIPYDNLIYGFKEWSSTHPALLRGLARAMDVAAKDMSDVVEMIRLAYKKRYDAAQDNAARRQVDALFLAKIKEAFKRAEVEGPPERVDPKPRGR